MMKIRRVFFILLLISSFVAAEWVTPGFLVNNLVQYTTSESLNSALGTGDYYKYTWNYSNPEFGYSAYFKEKSSSTRTHPMAVVRNGYLVTQSPQDMSLGSSTIGKKLSGTYVVDGATVTYPDQYDDGIDLVYVYGTYDVKESVVIDLFTRLPSASSGDVLTFTQKIKAYNYSDQGRAMRQKLDGVLLGEDTETNATTEVLTLVGHDDSVIWTMQQPVAIDADGDTIVLDYTVKVNLFGNLVVDVHTPYDWLESATYPVVVDPTWTSPSSVTDYGVSQDASSTAANTVDGNTGTAWYYKGASPNTGYWNLTVDMGVTTKATGIRIYTLGKLASQNSPCRVNSIKFCNDINCDGESNLISATLFGASDSDANWYPIAFSSTTGRYLKIETGEYWQDDASTCSNGDELMSHFYELEVEITLAGGEACSGDGDCTSGFCEESVCCDTNNCNSGTCKSCLAANTASADGVCDDIDDGSDPFGECTASGSGDCTEDNCDGAGACDALESTQGECSLCYTCNDGDVACDLVADGSDTHSECTSAGSGDCTEDNCDGAGACDILETTQGDCPLCQGCSDADLTCDFIADGADTYTECTTAGSGDCTEDNCDGAGACDILETGEGDCAACYTCTDADVTCELIADNTQDSEGSNVCEATCKTCDGTGSCDNQDADEDLFGQCGIVQCDDGSAPPYYNAFDSNTCYYSIDVSAAAAKCENDGACKVNTDYCSSQGKGDTAGVTCDCDPAEIGCTGTTIGSCDNDACVAPDILTYTSNTTTEYKPPEGVGIVEFTIEIQNKSTWADTLYFKYGGTMGNITDIVNGSYNLLWLAQDVNVGNYSVIFYANDTDGRTQPSSPYYVLITNNTPYVWSVAVNNTPVEGDSDATCACNSTSPTGSSTTPEYKWFVDGLSSSLTSTQTTTDEYWNTPLICSCRGVNANWNSLWTNSSTVTLQDTTAPTLLVAATVTDETPCIGSFSRVEVNFTDTTSNISGATIPNINPTGSGEPSMTCGSGRSVYCTYVFQGYSGLVTTSSIKVTDDQSNTYTYPYVQTITFTDCGTGYVTPPPGGGGGGGGIVDDDDDDAPGLALLDYEIVTPDIVSPPTTDKSYPRGETFITQLIVENQNLVPIDFTVEMVCNSSENCMADWCIFRNQTEKNIYGQNFILSVSDRGKFFATIECTVPVNASNEEYVGELKVQACNTAKTLCDPRSVPMKGYATDTVFFTQKVENWLNKDVISFTDGCQSALCYDVGGSPIELGTAVYNGVQRWLLITLILSVSIVLSVTLSVGENEDTVFIAGVGVIFQSFMLLYILGTALI